MKVIDLFNKIANGGMPNRILYDHYIWSWTGDDYRTEIDGKEQFLITGMYYTWFTKFVNEEVEIIEEDKKIEKLNLFDLTVDNNEKDEYGNDLELHYTGVADTFDEVYNKINELIDEVNKLKEGKDE